MNFVNVCILLFLLFYSQKCFQKYDVVKEETKINNNQAFLEIGRCKLCHAYAGKKRLIAKRDIPGHLSFLF